MHLEIPSSLIGGIDFSKTCLYNVRKSINICTDVGKDVISMVAQSSTEGSFSNLHKVSSTAARPSVDEIRSLLISNIAKSMVIEETVLQEQLEMTGGNLMIKSLIGVAAIAQLEQQLGCKPLPGPEDLRSDQFTSIDALVALVDRKLTERESKTQKN